jgi:phosphoglycerate dehydrogenase-like enzyme
MKHKVYITLIEDDAEFLPEYRAEISEFADVYQNPEPRRPTDEEKATAVLEANIVMVGRSGGGLTREIIDGAKDLRAVGVVGGAVRMAQPDYLVEKGITLFNAGWAMSDSVAEFTVAMMLSGLRDIPHMISVMQSEGWGKARSPLDLGGRRIGLVGFGGIGRRVSVLLSPFRCDVTAYDPFADFSDTPVRSVELNALLERSEVVSIHAGMTEETRGLLGAAELARMPDNALLINTARARIVDEQALVAQLKTGRIRAALNVFWKEPLAKDHPLRDLDNVILTPHGGGLTHDRRVRQSRSLVDDLKRVCAGQKPEHEVTREMLLRMT